MTNKRGASWEGTAVINGKRARRSFKTQSQAEAFERYPLSADRTVEQEFRVAFEILWKGVTKDERGIYRTIELLIDAIGRKRFIWSIDTNDVHNLVLVWKKRKNTGGTINRKLCALRMVLKNCHARNMIPEMPAFPNKMPERPSRDGFLSLDEAERLIANLRHEAHRALALFLLHTGCRIGEAIKIGWEHINEHNHLTLVSENTKTQRTRIIGLNRRAIEALEYGKEKGWSSPWAEVNYWTFKDDWERAKKAANLDRPNIVPHILRHTHASWLSQRGVPIQKISKLLGHSSIEITMRYAKFAPNDLLDAAKILE